MLIQTRTRDNTTAYVSRSGFYTWTSQGIYLESYTLVGHDDRGPVYWTSVIEYTTRQIAALRSVEPLKRRIEEELRIDELGNDIDPQ